MAVRHLWPSFYVAVKICEHVQLGIGFVVTLCRGFYKESDILPMERDILFSLEWRVCLSTTTPMEYVRRFLETLPDWMDVAGDIQEHAAKYLDCVTRDIYFSTRRTSTVGVACLLAALNDTRALSPIEKKVLWHDLNSKVGFEAEMSELEEIQDRILSKTTFCGPTRLVRRRSQSSLNSAYEQPSSPVSVMQGL